MKIKRFLSALLILPLLLGLSACVESPSEKPAEEPVSADNAQAGEEPQTDENYETGDASLDDPRNGDDIGEDELLVVSFGTSYNDNRRLSIGAIEAALAEAFPDWSVRRAFTSQIIIDHVKSRDGEVIDNVGEALQRAVDNGVKRLVVQPTHLMHGYEYTDLVKELDKYAASFETVSVGEPLLSSDADFAAVAGAVMEDNAEFDDERTAVCLMGHGTSADSNGVYEKMQGVLREKGFDRCFVGTVEATPTLEDVLAAVKAGGLERVVLQPLMIVAGDHANNDMAGDEEGSWKRAFEDAGFETVCRLRGMGEMEDVQALFVEHARAAMDALAAPETTDDEGEEAPETLAAVDGSKVADGEYDISVDSSSSMFKVVSCRLTVQDGQMRAVLTLSGTGYSHLFLGTAEKAEAAPEEETIPFVEDESGAYTFELPVPALNTPVSVAAFSKKKQIWYDRELVFRADSLPEGALTEDAVIGQSLKLPDGEYQVQVELSGGSGKAGVESPALMTVKGGEPTLLLVWSSPNYDYMKLEGVRYDPVNEGGNSAFEIPVPAFDCELPIVADTVAMSKPHEVEYVLKVSSAGLPRP